MGLKRYVPTEYLLQTLCINRLCVYSSHLLQFSSLFLRCAEDPYDSARHNRLSRIIHTTDGHEMNSVVIDYASSGDTSQYIVAHAPALRVGVIQNTASKTYRCFSTDVCTSVDAWLYIACQSSIKRMNNIFPLLPTHNVSSASKLSNIPASKRVILLT